MLKAWRPNELESQALEAVLAENTVVTNIDLQDSHLDAKTCAALGRVTEPCSQHRISNADRITFV